jgi:hypothetical protein
VSPVETDPGLRPSREMRQHVRARQGAEPNIDSLSARTERTNRGPPPAKARPDHRRRHRSRPAHKLDGTAAELQRRLVQSNGELRDRAAPVIGGNGGIGRATALASRAKAPTSSSKRGDRAGNRARRAQVRGRTRRRLQRAVLQQAGGHGQDIQAPPSRRGGRMAEGARCSCRTRWHTALQSASADGGSR